MAERDDAPLADEPQPGSVPNDMPSGMPAGADDPEPLGPAEEAEPEGEGDRQRGEGAMPGIPDDTAGDEPFTAG
jgi:hypothetical protein